MSYNQKNSPRQSKVISYYQKRNLSVLFSDMSNELTVTKDTKSLIIEAALELFYEFGVHWVSFQQIANQVKISQPAIYKHYKDKDDLVCACTLNAAESGRAFIDSMVETKTSPSQKLHVYIEANLIWMDRNRKHGAMLLAMYYFSHMNARLKQVQDAIQGQSILRIKRQLDLGNENMTWKISNSELCARIIHDLLIGEMIKAFHETPEVNSKVRAKLVKNMVGSLIKGLSKK